MNFKPGLAHFFRISTTLKVLLEITTQVRPADLPLFQRQFIVSPPAVAADHPVNLDAQQGLEAISHPGLRERGFGAFEGKTFAEIEKDLPEDSMRWRKRDPHWMPPNGGESLVVMEQRVRQTLNELAAKHMGQHIALFAHGGVMDLLYRIATQQDLQAPRTWTLTNTAINRLLWTPQGVSLVGWADTSHLDESTRDEF